MKYNPKHYGLITYLDIVLLKLLLFELVHGQKVVLPVEVNLDAYRLAKQNNISAVDHNNLMMDNIDEVTNKRLRALRKLRRTSFRWPEPITKR